MVQKSTPRDFFKMASLAAASLVVGCISDKTVSKLTGGKNPKDYPVVVIGSGLGGLASAVYLSKAGFPVTVIEQHSIPGGYATAFQRGNFNFEVSLHFFVSPEPIYKELGLEKKVKRIELRMRKRFLCKGKDVTMPEQSGEQYVASLCKRYPGSQDGIRNYFNFCSELMDEVLNFAKKLETSFIFIPFMPIQYPNIWSLRNSSFSDLLNKHLKDPKIIQDMIFTVCSNTGLPPSELSGFIGAIMTKFMLEKFYYFKSRSQDLSNALVSLISDNKGTIVYNKTVNRILTENNRVTGVKTNDGKIYPAKIVVSNANAPDTFGKFLSDNKNAQKYMKKLNSYEPGISSFIVWLGLKGELKNKEHSIVIESGNDIETDFKNFLACDPEKTPIMIALYDNYFKGYSNPGTSTLTILILSGYEPWQRFEKDYFAGNKKKYNKEKMRIAKVLIKRIEEKSIPKLSSMIQIIEVATPLTNITFTKNPKGAIYGYPPNLSNSLSNRIKNSTPVEGLYLSSGWGNNSGSYTGGFMNGRDVYRKIMRDI